MERTPNNDFRTYRASSIADFLDNEGQIRQDTKALMGWISRVNLFFRFMEDGVGLMWTNGKWQYPAVVQVEIPSVSHLPVRDGPKHNALTIFDQTGEMEVELLEAGILIRRDEKLKDVEKYSWLHRHITLLVFHKFVPLDDSRFLTKIRDYLAPVTSRESVRIGEQIPILNPQLGNP